MSCWDILEIEATSDVKAVKKAYAKKLKVTKPDEDPEGFKALHTAYKQATKIAKGRAALAVEQPKVEDTEIHAEQADGTEQVVETETQTFHDSNYQYTSVRITNNTETDTGKDQEKAAPAEESTPVEILEDTNIYAEEDSQPEHADTNETEQYPSEELLAIAVQNLIEDKANANNIDEWEKLLTAPILFQIEVKGWFTFFLFNQVLSDQKSKVSSLNHETLTYLNQRVLWTHQTERLERHFSYEDINFFKHQLRSPFERLLDRYVCPKQHQGELEFANYYRKLLAGAIDLGIFFAGCYALLSINLPFEDFFWAFCSWFVVLFPAMEASPFQATPGKMLLGMKVLSPKGKRLNIIHAIIRSTLFALSTMAFKFTVWINLFVNDGRMLHDRLSYSWVVKK